MQDIYATGGGGAAAGDGGFFSSGGGDRRLRAYNSNHHHNQALKCPRCDSLNTKFCYYNNYNLSQPRHFCKSCRRYWTKGGVLRNVPVGGGCRKAKRAAKSKTAAAAASTTERSRSSSSESSTLSAAAAPAPAATATAGEEGSNLYDLEEMKFFGANPSFVDHQPLDADGHIFAAGMGSFTSLMASSEGMMSFGDLQTATYGRLQQGNNNQLAPVVEDSNNNDNNSLGPSAVGTTGMSNDDWGTGGNGSGGDQGLFDLTDAVDPAYWTQPQWSDDANDDDQAQPPLNYLP